FLPGVCTVSVLCCFFFQAEDGIRDFHVTGVQTCALPIFPSFQGYELLMVLYPFVQADRKGVLKAATIANLFVTFFYTFIVLACRSEERRVGKECKSLG